MVRGDHEVFDLVEVSAPSEQHLQEVVTSHPQLIPAEDLGLDGDLLVIGRETYLASGAIDLMCLSRTGEVVLVEFKTGPQNPDFRHALAQLIDYGSDLWGMTFGDFDNGVVQRYLASSHVQREFAGASSLRDAVDRTKWGLTEGEWEALASRVSDVLETGDFHFVVAAQRFTPPMLRSLEYVNSTMRHGRFYLLHVIELAGNGYNANSAQVVAGPTKLTSRQARSSGAQTSETEFLERIGDEDYREAMSEIFAAVRSLDLVLAWGAKGASIRLRTADRNEPLSVGWAFLEGDQWNGARHLTLGADAPSLETVPSVASAAVAFKAQVRAISGATPVTSKLDAWMFEPKSVVAGKEAIIAALQGLVSAAAGEGN